MKPHIKKSIEDLTPFPLFLEDGTILEGNIFRRHISCINCSARECLSKDFNYKYCQNGFRVITKKFGEDSVRFFGILTNISKHKLPLNLQKKIGTTAISDENVIKWIDKMDDFIKSINTTITEKSKEYMEGFHDITPTINLIIRNAEALIRKSEGTTFNEQFEKADDLVKTLYKSSETLSHHLQFMNYLSNPKSVNYGQKRGTRIYKLVDRIHRIFLLDVKNKQLRLSLSRPDGESKNAPQIYDSFATLIFILIENAIKYSSHGQEVTIEIKDTVNGGVHIDICSYGPIIPKEEVPNIFNKKYRYPKDNNIPGQGLGLYIANLIAMAHGISIEYTSSGNKAEKDGIILGENHFSINIP